MQDENGERFDQLFIEWRNGSISARDQLIAIVYPDLRRIAKSIRRRRGQHISLSTDDILHEAIPKILRKNPDGLMNRFHLLGFAAFAIRHTLQDELKSRRRQKRNINLVTLVSSRETAQDLVYGAEKIENLLVRLEAIDALKAEIVTLRFFGGLTVPEAANFLNISEAKAKREWEGVREWLEEAIVAS